MSSIINIINDEYYIMAIYIIYVLLLIFCMWIAGKNKKYEFFDTNQKTFVLKKQYHSVIPLNLFTTWNTKELPPMMKKNYESLKSSNPEFNHYLYDDNDCREFIKTHYDADVLTAFDKLVPGAYKADLWRYCILYKKGGIYCDIKFNCVNGFKLIALTEKEYFVRDWFNKRIYNAFMVCKAENPILLKLIQKIVHNTQTNFYGENSLHPTGPNIFTEYIDKETILGMELFNSTSKNNMRKNTITYRNQYGDTVILGSYDEYRDEQKKFQTGLHYNELWKQRKIYKKID
jgi:mannosyltransferase OCH1-like enzyme